MQDSYDKAIGLLFYRITSMETLLLQPPPVFRLGFLSKG